MCDAIMALFPAFAEVSENKVEDSSTELDWLNNKSFQAGNALSLHSRFLEKSTEQPNKREESVGRDITCSDGESSGKEDGPPKKKKKKSEKKRKKKKKHKKKSGRASGSSGSDSETIYPSDLKREEEGIRHQPASLGTRFTWLDDLQSPTENPFCVDRKPDPANWTYKSLYRGDVARYRRKGSSSLGLDFRRQGVSWEDSETKKKKKVGVNGNAADRYFSVATRKLLRAAPPVPVIPATPESGDVLNSTSFLPLGDAERDNTRHELDSKAQTSVNPLGVYDSSTSLWMQGKGRLLQDDAKPVAETEEKSEYVAGRTEEFNRRLREQPADTQLWIEFIRYQDELSAAAFGGDEEQQGSDLAERRKSSYRAILEKKLSIADRAVETNPTCVALQLERLRICQDLWEPSTLAKEWKKLVFLHPNSAPLWRKYLLFTQSYFSSFSVTKVNSAYGKCLSTLSAVRDGSMVSHPALPGIEEDMLDIFTQQCHFLRQSGHCEKAISLFQAMIDFSYFKPDSVKKLSTKQQVDFFETFWDSGEARVGEVGARGWKAWMTQQERGGWVQPPAEEEEEEEEEEDEEEVKDRSQPRGTVWLEVESSREAAHWLPWRPDKAKGQSEEDCEDPDRQVLFDDIGPSLICLTSPELQLRFLLSFLAFLGFPVDFVLSAAPYQPSMLLENLSLLTQGASLQRPLTSFNPLETGINPVGHMTTLQGTRKWLGLGKQGEKFLTNVFSMLQPFLPPPHRAVLSLSWMLYEKLKVLHCLRSGNKKRLRAQGKSSKRVAKRLLKEPDNRSSLVLWREYAHLEWVLGNLDEARKVFSTATAMGGTRGLGSPALCELCLLWSQLEVENSAKEPGGVADVTTSPAVAVLTRLAEGTSSSSSSQTLTPVSILKARRSYDQVLSSSLSSLDQKIQNHQQDGNAAQDEPQEDKLRLRGLVGCYALFQYLTVSIQAAIAVYSQARERMEELHRSLTPERQPDHDEATTRPSRTVHSQHVSWLASDSWPYSAPLWSVYIQVENRYHSAGRARRFFTTVTRDNSSSVVPRLFAIVAEQHRKQLVDAAQRSCCLDEALPILPENGLSNRIRGLFEGATSTEIGAHCPLLWRMYIHFLVSEGKVDKARGIFYKALQNIPWVKGLYMDAVQLFPDHLQEFVDLMTEKELRLRLPLEELDILLED
uniref:NRDE-2, necessary for RNA interference, domain containing n=1 Tax=Poecilia formosa TaxID=48698 RepID=A0A087Y5I1_POEFO